MRDFEIWHIWHCENWYDGDIWDMGMWFGIFSHEKLRLVEVKVTGKMYSPRQF